MHFAGIDSSPTNAALAIRSPRRFDPTRWHSLFLAKPLDLDSAKSTTPVYRVFLTPAAWTRLETNTAFDRDANTYKGTMCFKDPSWTDREVRLVWSMLVLPDGRLVCSWLGLFTKMKCVPCLCVIKATAANDTWAVNLTTVGIIQVRRRQIVVPQALGVVSHAFLRSDIDQSCSDERACTALVSGEIPKNRRKRRNDLSQTVEIVSILHVPQALEKKISDDIFC